MFQSPDSGAGAPTVAAVCEPSPEKIRLVVYGSLAGCDRTIKILHSLHYAEPNDWTEPLPTGRPHEWMRMVTKRLRLE